jgi:hypothetical protein
MMIEELATISFRDGDSGSDAVAIVRRCGDGVALAISLRSNGDVEVLADASTARTIAEAIMRGVELIDRGRQGQGGLSG